MIGAYPENFDKIQLLVEASDEFSRMVEQGKGPNGTGDYITESLGISF